MPESAPEESNIAGTSAGGETVTAPAGNSSVSGFGGGDVLIGSSGDNRHWIADPKDVVREQPGGGIDTEIGWTSIKLAPNVENLLVHGDFNYAAGNELANLITVDGRQWVWGAGGDDVLVGGFNPVTFVVRAGEGSDVIYGWNSADQIQLWNYGLNTAAEIRQAMTQQGADVVFNFANGESLTIRDTTVGAIQDKNFLVTLDRSQLGTMTFGDEFNSLSLYDPSLQTGNWRTDFTGNLKDVWAYSLVSNGEAQVYVAPGFQGTGHQDLDLNPFSIANGQLTITAQQIEADKQFAAFGRAYSSGMLNTLGLFEQKYGYFEMRAELPQAAGAWPAFWMFPTPYTPGVEGDIMEALGATPNVDYRRAYGGDVNVYDNAFRPEPAGMHKYGLLWTPTTVAFYYDDVEVLKTTTPANWTVPMGLIVDMAVGGWGGEPDLSKFPAEMKIDFIHAYALKDGSTIVERTDPEAPVSTLRASGGATSGQSNAPVAFDDTGAAVTTGQILITAGHPTSLPAGHVFAMWEEGGAVYGAVSDAGSVGTPQILFAGSISQATGTGTFLTDGRAVAGFTTTDASGKTAWVVIFDPVKGEFIKQELGASAANADIHVVATAHAGFAVSWDAPDGTTHARGWDSFAYDGEGWAGPVRTITGDLTGVTASGKLIAASGGGQQLYDMLSMTPITNPRVLIDASTTVTHPEGSGLTEFTFTVTRDTYLWQRASVGWTVSGTGANPANAADFKGGVLPSGVVTFDINETSHTVSVFVQGDAVSEADEDFQVTLRSPDGTTLGTATAYGKITNDDTGAPPAQPTIALATPSLSLNEGATGSTAFAFTVSRSGSTTGASSVNWAVTGSGTNAASGSDFTGGALPAGTLTFAAGETSKVITVNVAGDTTVEPNETFTLTLSGPTGATLGAATATGAIVNDDSATPPPTGGGQVINSPGAGSTLMGGSGDDTLNASAGNDVLTGGAGADKFAWSNEPWAPARVTDFQVGTDKLDLSAVFQRYGYTGSDPVADKWVVLTSDNAGGTNVLFDHDGAGPNPQWPNYILQLEHVSPNGLTWAQLTGAGGSTPPPQPSSPQIAFASTSLSLNEGASGSTAFAFTVNRTGPTTGTSTVAWSVAGSSASASDFVGGALPSGTLTFAAGETSKTITVNVAGDTTVEPDETFSVTLSGPTGATLGAATATGAIVNDDSATPPPTGGGQVINSPGAGSTLTGGSGDDTLNASAGNDVLTGGAGADKFAWSNEPWAPARVTDFQVGTDKLDLSAVFQRYGYTGSDPVADKWVYLSSDNAGGTNVLFDHDGAGPNPQWPNYILQLEHVSPNGLTWAQLTGAGGSTPPPQPSSPQIAFASTSLSLNEGASGSTAFAFTVNRTGPTTGTSTVAWTVAGSGANAAAATDFAGGTLPSGTVTFAAGETSKTITVNVAGDTTVEPNETFSVTLSGATGATLGTATATGAIVNDDSATPPPTGGGQVINSPGPGSTLMGGAGDDTLNASQGADQLTGGAGADHFVYAREPWAPGHITDFVAGTDKIDLRPLFDSLGYTGTDPFGAGYIKLMSDGADGTKVLFDHDGAGPNPQWPNFILTVDHVGVSTLSASSNWIFE